MSKALCWLPLCGFTLLLAPCLFGQTAGPECALRLGVQACDTQCQSTETDCDLACDQVVACVEDCKKASEVCVQRCHDAPPTSKPDASGKPPIVAEKRKPTDGKKPAAPSKAPPKAAPKAPAK